MQPRPLPPRLRLTTGSAPARLTALPPPAARPGRTSSASNSCPAPDTGCAKAASAKAAPAAACQAGTESRGRSDQLIPLRGAAARIAENMTASLSIPVATSQRRIPVRVIEENRNIINKYRALQGKGKLSFTHFIAWAIVKALKSNPASEPRLRAERR